MGTGTQRVIDLPDLVAVELAGAHDRILRALEERLEIDVHLRGNRLTLSGDPERVRAAKVVIGELSQLVGRGEALGEAAIEAVAIGVEDSEPLAEMRDDVLLTHRRRQVSPRTAGQKRYTDAIRGHTITFGIGPAGTGKTYLAVALAAAALRAGEVSRVILSRPAVEAGERLGFLPGDLSEKVDPYIRPLFDALYDMIDAEQVEAMLARGQIEIAPLAFMRGRTLNDAFVILDEAQNTSAEQMKMFLTRLGYGSKMVITGDATQVDLPAGSRSGLHEAPRVLADVPGIAFINLGKRDVVRHRLVQGIVAAYERDETADGPPG